MKVIIKIIGILLMGVCLVGCQGGGKSQQGMVDSQEETTTSQEQGVEEGSVSATTQTETRFANQGIMLNDNKAIVKLEGFEQHSLVEVTGLTTYPNPGERFSFTYKTPPQEGMGQIQIDGYQLLEGEKIVTIPINEGVSMAWNYTGSLIDVRTKEEYATGYIPEALNIPLDALSGNLSQLNKEMPVFLYCRSGNRSMQAAQILEEAGFQMIINIGGINDYTGELME